MVTGNEWLLKIMMLPAVLFALSFHEFCHAYTADKLGDETPARQGRLTMNPIAHLDLIGFLLFLFANFGWAKPVQVNSDAFRKPRRDEILVSLAGPVSNLSAAIIFAVVIKIMLMLNGYIFNGTQGNILFGILVYFVWLNLILAFLNILPIPPLDGSHILFNLLPARYDIFKEQFFRYGSTILIGLILIENVTRLDILPFGKIAYFVYRGLFHLLQIS